MCCKCTTRDPWLYFPSVGSHTQDFYALKNPSALAGFEPANLGSSGQYDTTEPPGSTEGIVIAWTHIGRVRWTFLNLPLPAAQEVRDSIGITSCIVMKNDGVVFKCRRFLLNPCDYDFFAQVKDPLRRTWYNTRDELIRAIRRSVRNINKDGRADGVRRLPNIWQKVINKVHKCCTSVNKAMSEISNCCHYFHPTLGKRTPVGFVRNLEKFCTHFFCASRGYRDLKPPMDI